MYCFKLVRSRYRLSLTIDSGIVGCIKLWIQAWINNYHQIFDDALYDWKNKELWLKNENINQNPNYHRFSMKCNKNKRKLPFKEDRFRKISALEVHRNLLDVWMMGSYTSNRHFFIILTMINRSSNIRNYKRRNVF